MRTQYKARILLAAFFSIAAAQTHADAPASATPNAQVISPDNYRKHLDSLSSRTQACAKARDKATCDPQKIGSDDHLNLGAAPNTETRVIRYDWLRALFLEAQKLDAQKPDPKPDKSKKPEQPSDTVLPAPKTTSQLLDEAQKRLTADAAQTTSPAQPTATHTAESQTMRQVLTQREFRRLQKLNPGQSVYEKAMQWLNRIFNGVGHLLNGAAWVGRLLVWGFLLAVGVALVWALLQLERRWRIRLVPDTDGPAPTAASARDWQLWLEDARRAADAGLWREAIHFLYWASISRLESRRLWPADRARTPREYLALVAPEDPRKPSLAQLTNSFEHVWYGGRPASETDYRHADTLATALIQGGQPQ